jgi:hypothetical protein
MNGPRRLTEESPQGLEQLSGLVRTVAQPRPMTALHVDALMAAGSGRAAGRGRFGRDLRFFFASAAVAAAAKWFVMRVVFTPPAFIAEPGARLVATAADAPAKLYDGRVRGRPSAQLAQLSTPHASVAWLQARFLLDVDVRRSLLSVEEGEVMWRADGEQRTVRAGERAQAPAPLVVPKAFESAAVAPSSACPASSLDERTECLERLARGDGLTAQNALFEWALVQRDGFHRPDKAVEGWRTYLTRFPDGILAPEASLGLLADLVRLERYSEALAVARVHRERFPALFPDEVSGLEAKLTQRVSRGTP